MRALVIVAFLALTAGLAAGQAETCETALAAGEKELAAKQKEAAAFHIREARRAALAMPAGSARDALLKRVKRLIRKADPKDPTYDRVVNRSANDLVDLARHYLKIGWVRTAGELVRMAESLNPQACLEVREELLSAMRTQRLNDPKALTIAIDAGLDWLARHQDPKHGGWDGDGFHLTCRGQVCRGKAFPLYDEGLTGLAVLAFLEAGHIPGKGKYGSVVKRGLHRLMKRQASDGSFGDKTGHYMYSQCVAALALVEAYARGEEADLEQPARKAVAFLLRAQNRSEDGEGREAWRYTARDGENDTSVTGWAVKAVARGRDCGFEVPAVAIKGARDWLDKMTYAETGRIGYVQRGVSPVRAPDREQYWPRSLSEAITAIGIESKLLLGYDPKDPLIQRGLMLIEEDMPRWDADRKAVDHYYWHAGTKALARIGGPIWERWRQALFAAVIPNQCMTGCATGSFDPVGPWGEDGGRVYSTAILVSALATVRAHAGK